MGSYVEADRHWFGKMPEDDRADYSEIRQRALADPKFDLFEHFRRRKPKRDIGRYVLKHGFRVPLVRSQKEWEGVFDAGLGMLRSELPQDYDGYSDLLHSQILAESRHGLVGDELPAVPSVPIPALGNVAVESALQDTLMNGMREGQIDPDAYMRHFIWPPYIESLRSMSEHANVPLKGSITANGASFWRYVPGYNLRVFRDPVRTDYYYVGGAQPEHAFEVSGEEINNDRAFGQGDILAERDDMVYTIPVARVAAMYEQIRALPYFDSSELPVMEMQLGLDDKLYFLQYLKTGNKLDESPPFVLPTGRGVFHVSNQVRGKTAPEGERLRLYLDPHKRTVDMDGQGFYGEYNVVSRRGDLLAQYAAKTSRVFISADYLSFKDSHVGSSPLSLPKVAIGLWRGDNEDLARQFRTAAQPTEGRNEYADVRYINALVTSNGREATIESDWEATEVPV